MGAFARYWLVAVGLGAMGSVAWLTLSALNWGVGPSDEAVASAVEFLGFGLPAPVIILGAGLAWARIWERWREPPKRAAGLMLAGAAALVGVLFWGLGFMLLAESTSLA